jgi:hypothetical protein
VIRWIWIRIRIHISNKLDSDPHQFADDNPNVWNMSLFEHFFKVLSLYLELEASILILIRTAPKCKVGSGSEPHQSNKQDPDQSYNQDHDLDPDPQQSDAQSATLFKTTKKNNDNKRLANIWLLNTV